MRLRSGLLAVSSLAFALAGGLALTGSIGVRAQTAPTPASAVGGPQNVPSARYFGSVTLNNAPAPTGAQIAAIAGTTTCGISSVSVAGSYFVDAQAIGGCTAPGTPVKFTVNGFPAVSTPAAVIPDIQGTALLANLAATTVTPSPTPSPTPSATAPPPPPPPAPPTAAPTRPPTAAPPTPAPTVVRPSVPPVTGLGGGTSQQKPAAPIAQKAGAAVAAPVARPALPNTGTGGLNHRSTGQQVLLFAVLASACGLLLLGVRTLATRRA